MRPCFSEGEHCYTRLLAKWWIKVIHYQNILLFTYFYQNILLLNLLIYIQYYYHYTISVYDHSSYFAASPLQFHLPVPLHALTSRLIASLSWGELHDAPRSDLHNGTCSLHHRCPLSLCYIFLQRFCFLLLYMQRKKRVQNCTCHLSSPTVCLSVGLRSKLICKVL